MTKSFSDIFTYDLLYDLYIIKKTSSIEICKMFNVSKVTILNYLRKYNITKSMQTDDYKIKSIHHDLIIGSALGDGAFVTDGNDYRMSFRQAENQRDYLIYKFEIMKEFCKQQKVGISDGNQRVSLTGNSQLMYWFNTRALPIFKEYKDRSIMQNLELLNVNSFAIWLMDDGSFYHRNPRHTPYYTLSAKRFSEEEVDKSLDVFNKSLNLKARVVINADKETMNRYKMGCFYFPTSETSKIVEIIHSSTFGERLKTAMSYKLTS